MKIAVLGDDVTFELLKSFNANIEWIRITSATSIAAHTDVNAIFDLTDNASQNTTLPVTIPSFINSVLVPKVSGANSIRINGWKGFLENETWEVAGTLTAESKSVLKSLGKEFIEVPDEAGFVAPRIIAMIINEAFYALEDGVSTREEIDIAMKLGTNYPLGPFEWAEKIGLANVHALLEALSQADQRYRPCNALLKQLNKA